MGPRTLLFPLSLLSLAAPFSMQAQEIELASYTPEQRWERAASQFTVANVSAIAYAKSLGKSVEEAAEASARLFAPGWGEAGSGTLGIVRGMHRNLSLWPNSEFEIVDQSDQSVTARSNRPWARYFGEEGMWYGVSLEEYETTFHVFNSLLAEHLGLGYEDWMEDGWWYFRLTLGI